MEITLKETDDTWVEVSKQKSKVKIESPIRTVIKPNSQHRNQKQAKRNQSKTQDSSSVKLSIKKETYKVTNRERSESEHSKTSETSSQSVPTSVNNEPSVSEILIQTPTKLNPWMNVESLSVLKSCDENQEDVVNLGLSLNQLSVHEQRVQHSFKPNDFCDICRNFDVTSSELMNFHIRWCLFVLANKYS